MCTTSFTLKSKLALILLGATTLSQAATSALLPIASGTYVIASSKPCRDAPLAGIAQFDGRALHGPHESDCTSSLLSRHGKTYRISTTCRAFGDGSPAKPDTQVQTVRVESRTRFEMIDGSGKTDYARCPSFR